MGLTIAFDIVLNKSGVVVTRTNGQYIWSGMINNTKLADLILPDRIKECTENILDPVYDYLLEAEYVVIERAVVGQNAGGALNQSILIGSVMISAWEFCSRNNVYPRFILLNNKVWKRILGVRGKTSKLMKEDTLLKMNRLYPDLKIADDNISDALAMAYVINQAPDVYELMKEK